MPSLDRSTVKLPRCRRPGCGHFHDPDRTCPAHDVWLVGLLCPACAFTYCVRHAPQEFGKAIEGVRIGRPPNYAESVMPDPDTKTPRAVDLDRVRAGRVR